MAVTRTTHETHFTQTGGETVKRTIHDLRRELFGLETAAASGGKAYGQAGERLDFLRQRAVGLKRDISALRNNILLLVFATTGFINTFQKGVKAAMQFEVALTGLNSIAFNTGNSLTAVKQTAISLTEDGLLSISGAAQGLKNLLATGLNLEQSVKIMNVFKDAAAFNRQGILEFEEAIIRATAGVKMQNARLIDDVGIRTRVGQMLREQGFELEDLTSEVNKAAAVQALYNGLLKEGRFFSGDAAKLAGTYAGAQAKLETQMLRTQAAFGEILIGTKEIKGVFTEGTVAILGLLKKLQDLTRWNRDIISVNIRIYFERLVEVLETLSKIFYALYTAAKPFLDILLKSGMLNLIAIGLVFERLAIKMWTFQSKYIEFFGREFQVSALKSRLAIMRLGPAADTVATSFARMKSMASVAFKEVQFPKGFGTTQLGAMAKYAGLSKTKDTGIPIVDAYKRLRMEQSEAVLRARESLNRLQTGLNSLNISQLTAYRKELQLLAKTVPAIAPQLRPIITQVRGMESEFRRASIAAKGLGISTQTATTAISIGINKMKVSLAAFWAENKYLLIFQAAMIAVIEIWSYLSGKQEEARAEEERGIRVKEESLRTQKEYADSRLSEMMGVRANLEEYKRLHESIGKTESEYDRLAELQIQIRKGFREQKLSLENVTSGSFSYSKALGQTKIRLEELMETQKKFAIQQVTYDISKTWKELEEKLPKTLKTLVDTFRLAPKDIFKEYIETITGSLSEMMSESLYRSGMTTEMGFLFTSGFFKMDAASKQKFIESVGRDIDNYVSLYKQLMSEALLKSDVKESERLYNLIQQAERFKDALGGGLLDKLKAFREEVFKLMSPGTVEEAIPIDTKKLTGAFAKFMIGLRSEAEKADIFGSLAEKLIDIEDKAEKWMEDIKGYQAKMMPTAQINEAVRLVEKIRATAPAKIIHEVNKEFRDLNEELTLQYQKLTASESKQKELEVTAKKLSNEQKIKRRILELEIALEQDQISNNGKYSILLLAEIKFLDDQLNLLKLMTDQEVTMLRIQHQYAVGKEWKEHLLDVEKNTLEFEKTLDLLKASSDMEELINLHYEKRNALLESEKKIFEVTSSIREMEAGGVAFDIEKLDLWYAQLSSAYRMRDVQQEILDLELKRAEATRKVTEQAAEAALKSQRAGSKYGAGGALASILGGGTQFGGEDVYGAMIKYTEAIESAKAKIQEKYGAKTWYEGIIKASRTELLEFEKTQEESLESLRDAWSNFFESILTWAIDAFDLFGLKALEATTTIRENLKTDLMLLDDQFRAREVTAKEFYLQKELLVKKAALEDEKQAKLRSVAEREAVAGVLKALAIEFQARAIGSLATAALASMNPWAAAALYQAAAIAAGAAAVAIGTSAVRERAQVEAYYRGQETLLERQIERRRTGTTSGTTVTGKSISGTVSAQEIKITIAPTITISGQNVMVGDMGIEEVGRILGDMAVKSVQEAIDNRELSFEKALQ